MKNQFSKQIHKAGQELEDRFDEHQDHTGRFIASFILGLAIGGITALLYAPKKGEEYQNDISEGWDQTKEKATKIKDKAGDYIKEAADSVKGNAEGAVDAAKNAF